MSEDDLKGFGERLRVARERVHLSQEELAAKVETDKGSVSRWERGRGYPQAPQLAKLALAVGETLDHLVLGSASKQGPRQLPDALLEFLQTELGRTAQQRHYLPTLITIECKPRQPTVAFYRAIVAGLLAADDG